MRILVAGGGFAGLLAARRLASQGCDVEVWEASDRSGGWVWTQDWPGPEGEPGALEVGPQELRFRPGDGLDRLVRELGSSLLASPSRNPRWIVRKEGRFPQPRGLRDLLLGPGLSARSRLRLLMEPLVPARPFTDLEGLLVHRVGQDAVWELAEPLLASLVAQPLAEVGLEAIPGLATWRGSLAAFARAQAGTRSWVPEGGVGTLAQTLARGLGDHLRLGCPVEAVRAVDTGWEVQGRGRRAWVDRVVLALPNQEAARLLEAVAPEAAARVRGIPCADLLCWHSRHPGPSPWPRGFHLAAAPRQEPPVLGVISLAEEDPRGVVGGIQLRTYLRGREPLEWPVVEAWLRTWIPELPPAFQVCAVPAPSGFPVPAPGHAQRCAEVDEFLPQGLVWTGAGRLGAGLGALAEGLSEGWNPFISQPLL